MKLACDPSSPELKVSVKTVFNKRRRTRIISFSIVFLALSIMLFSTEAVLNLVLGFVCIGFALLMPAVHIIGAVFTIRDIENHKFSLSFNEKGMIFETKQSFFVDYESCEVFEDKDLFTILADRSQIYCVPKRCFENEKIYAEFEGILADKLQKRYFKSK